MLMLMLMLMLMILIKGAEFEVLKQVPWEKVNIEVLLVELEHAGKVHHDPDDALMIIQIHNI